MMLTGRNEWIAIGALILWIAFVPCPYQMKEFFASPVGKVVALGAVIYAWKYVSMPVAILLLVAFLRSGSLREYLEGETGMTPPTTGSTDYTCPSEFTYVAEKKMCTKGNETKPPSCTKPGMKWDSAVGACVSEAPASTSSNGGPPGGATPGSMAAMNEMANAVPPTTIATESFTPYGGKKTDNFASL